MENGLMFPVLSHNYMNLLIGYGVDINETKTEYFFKFFKHVKNWEVEILWKKIPGFETTLKWSSSVGT